MRIALNWFMAAAAVVLISSGRAEPQVEASTAKPLPSGIAGSLAPIRDAAKLPAMAAAIVTSHGIVTSGVVGVRKMGTDIAATIDDDWHLGSDTKAMTATLVGIFIDEGKLTFESTVEDVFPDLAAELPASFRKVTVAQLLAHRTGLPHDADWRSMERHGSLVEQRREAVRSIRDAKLVGSPGQQYSYSNWDYVILGAMAERVGGKPWEELIRIRVFEPLKMEHVGFGGLGTEGKVDQPWPHKNGRPVARNGVEADNAAVMAPAGNVHCPIGEWAKFIANELRGSRGERNLLSAATFKRLHTAEFGGTYAGGWIVGQRSWAKGVTYSHAGSNTMNYAVAWLAPQRDVAFLVCTNDSDAGKPCDQAVAALLAWFAAKSD
jgi:CubicO group peptidase (beta-lactamase class C family)